MDIIELMNRFSTQEDCILFLEELRWGGEPCCIHCGSIKVGRKNKKSISSTALARHLNMNQKSAWYMEMRIRRYMEDEDELLKGIVEADETYIGGKPRYRNKRGIEKSKRGRGTKKASVIGAVERGGKVVAKLISDVTTRSINRFVTNNVDIKNTTLMTDEYKGYNDLERNVISHKEKKYVDGDIHTNTVEGFWSEVKRACRGNPRLFVTCSIKSLLFY